MLVFLIFKLNYVDQVNKLNTKSLYEIFQWRKMQSVFCCRVATSVGRSTLTVIVAENSSLKTAKVSTCVGPLTLYLLFCTPACCRTVALQGLAYSAKRNKTIYPYTGNTFR